VHRARTAAVVTLGATVAVLVACASTPPMPAPTPSSSATARVSAGPSVAPSDTPVPTPAPSEPSGGGGASSSYPWHHGIPATTFWVGEIFDPDAPDGSQEISTYDSDWLGSYGGCDGLVAGGGCRTEARTAANDYFPTSMTPLQNPFYLDLPYDDVNDPTGFAQRDAVIPWAGDEPYRSHRGDQSFSYLKNRWVQLVRDGRTCYGQIEDAGPGEYHDAAYVFGTDDARPASTRYGGAGLDVSPALTGCLGFPELDGIAQGISWRFVEAHEVPPGPWTRIVTTSDVR
jgi:hypothetical protein